MNQEERAQSIEELRTLQPKLENAILRCAIQLAKVRRAEAQLLREQRLEQPLPPVTVPDQPIRRARLGRRPQWLRDMGVSL